MTPLNVGCNLQSLDWNLQSLDSDTVSGIGKLYNMHLAQILFQN